jgi:hypothetical protein
MGRPLGTLQQVKNVRRVVPGNIHGKVSDMGRSLCVTSIRFL